jgi:hypothetical protein
MVEFVAGAAAVSTITLFAFVQLPFDVGVGLAVQLPLVDVSAVPEPKLTEPVAEHASVSTIWSPVLMEPVTLSVIVPPATPAATEVVPAMVWDDAVVAVTVGVDADATPSPTTEAAPRTVTPARAATPHRRIRKSLCFTCPPCLGCMSVLYVGLLSGAASSPDSRRPPSPNLWADKTSTRKRGKTNTSTHVEASTDDTRPGVDRN